ncbi:MAG: type IV pilus biogenesis protein PilM [Gammaproteobacteria bacterium]
MRWSRSFFSSQKTFLFGLDINSAALRLLALTRLDDQYCVQVYGQELLAEHVMLGHHVQDIPALAHSIQNLLIKVDLWARPDLELHAAIAVPDACTFHKTIQVSERLQNDDLEELVSIELTKCIPETLTDIYYDFKPVGNTAQPGMKELLIVAARAKYIKDRVNALRSIDLNTSIVEVESLAVQRAVPFLDSQKVQGISVIIDMEDKYLKVFFFKQETLLFVHEEELIQSVNQENSYLEEIMQRFKRACHFLSAKYAHSESLTQIVLAGSGAQNNKRLTYFQQFYDCPIYRANPFTQMKITDGYDKQQLTEEAPLYLTACGLAKRVC